MMQMRCRSLGVLLSAGFAPFALGQLVVEPAAARVQVQVFNPELGTWGSSVQAVPSSRVEWRVMVSYVGTNTSVTALGAMRYQVTLSNADNTGPTLDTFAPWRNGGQQGNTIAGSMLTATQGADGGALESYGRVVYGAVAANSTSQNTITTWRHGGDFPRPFTPPGSWLRIAGELESVWPQRPFPGESVPPSYLTRGLQANQLSAVNAATNMVNTFHVTGTQSLVVFRGALLLSDDTQRAGNLILDIPIASMSGGPALTPTVEPIERDPYFISWQTSPTDNGTWRTGVTLESATIFIPTPGLTALLSVSALFTLRRVR